MLDLLKVATQMQGMSEQLAQEAQQLMRKLDRAEELFNQASDRQEELCQQRARFSDRLIFNCAEPIEPLTLRHQIAPMTGSHCVIATDGSQIAPSRHEAAYCYLVNVGRVALHYGSGTYPHLDSVPEIFYKPEDLYGARQWGISTEEWMGLRRTAAEAIALTELALAQKNSAINNHSGHSQPLNHLTSLNPANNLSDQPNNQNDRSLDLDLDLDNQSTSPMLALSDGSLIYWSLEALPREARDRILPDMLTAWDLLKMAQIPLAGYISAPRAVESTNFLRLPACPFEQPDCQTHCQSSSSNSNNAQPIAKAPCSKIQPTRDATLWHRLLQPGECSPLWRSNARILNEYGDAQQIYFCYLHVGVEIARVEMPAWTALDFNLRNQALSMILAQIQKGYGYPVALAEAHNQAVVTGSDRRRFFTILEQQMLKSGLSNLATSYKEARKRGSIA
ncbi:NurA domain-containing protein [Thalassoporum mexicanum PCC 7367]|uniref:DNA double-strand break repair nuclease NurA n=1 Tax=Thalassoporum mexicanum TaxID=3457544 RepID=UPI00029FA726|nr:DNA double-strand break repair nuclease NurA [Pseudanabaena sp. PCC 7367]AFY69735.1 NurA domain-containing protein [Pseudanabaena sp. PCC 7367]